ncbi:MAG: FapA family protein [Desulfotalea sp.]
MSNNDLDKNSLNDSEDFEGFEDFLGDLDSVDGKNQESTNSSKFAYLGNAGNEVVFLRSDEEKCLSTDRLTELFNDFIDFYRSKYSENVEYTKFAPLAVTPGARIAYEQTLRGDFSISGGNAIKIAAGDHVERTSSGDYIAEKYGYICVINNILQILSPIQVKGNLEAIIWYFSGSPTNAMDKDFLEFWFKRLGVPCNQDNEIEKCLMYYEAGSLEADCYTLASSIPAIDGKDGQIKWFIDIEERIGTSLPNDKIDFKDRNLVVSAVTGQKLAQLTSPTLGISGKNLKGEELTAKHGTPARLRAGKHIQLIEEDEEILFFAETEGALHHDGDMIYLSEELVLYNGVNYKTGNIDFTGDVVVRGAIASGFTIRAGGDVTVSAAIQDGVTIESDGDIVISLGVSGKRTRIAAGGNVTTPYVNEATIVAGGDIILGDYVYHGKLRARGSVQVKYGSGDNSGSVMGGEIWATKTIDIYIAGTKAWADTELVAGVLPEQVLALDNVQKNIRYKNTHLRQILDYFGVASIDLKKIKSIIEKSDGMTRKSMALRAKYLAQVGKSLKSLLGEQARLKASIGPAPADSQIIIRQNVYTNVTASVGNHKHRFERDMGPTTLLVELDQLVVK